MSTPSAPNGGSADPADPVELVGRVLGGSYRLTALVSAGANTTVFDGVDDTTGRAVAVKLVRHAEATSPDFHERFSDTMRQIAALSHPNIAAVYDWGIDDTLADPSPYVVAEQLTGGSLRDMFDRARQLTPSQALALGLDACRGLDYAHRRGFVHSELTPSKIVFGDDRRLRITDFGLASLLNASTWDVPDQVDSHTAWYASPEQGRGESISGATDVYSLCLVLQEAVTGTLPFKHDSTVASLSARQNKLMPVSADLGPLASVLEHAGRPEADDRASAAQFGKGLVGAAAKLPRPEPLPLLSTGLFETPAERLRSPDDPTGGVVRPVADADSAPTLAPVVVPQGDDLVILPLDSDLDTRLLNAQPTAPAVIEPESDAPGAATAPLPATVANEAAPTQTIDEPRRARAFPWRMVLAVLVVAALGVLAVLATRLFETPSFPVPDLVEMPEAEARNVIAPNQWVLTVERERSDVVPVVGQVVRTTPTAGVELAEGEPFLMVVSDGPTLRELPESTGETLVDAQTRLLERGLDVPTPIEQFDEIVADGVVIEWYVPGDPTLTAGALVEPTTPVQLVVSDGPAPRTVPSVTGQTVAEAEAELAEIQLTLTNGGQEFSDDVPIGLVLWQSIEAGTVVERGTDVTVVVSKGPDVVAFPDLSSAATYDDAAVILTDAGFVPNLVFGDAQGEIQSVEIDGEEPEVGETYRRGTQVDIRAL